MKILYFLFVLLFSTSFVFGQTVKYTPPENFIFDQNANVDTYINKAAGALIQITTKKAIDFNSFYENFDEEQLIENELEIIAKDSHIVNGDVQHFYYKCKYKVNQEHEGQISDYMRIIYFTQNDDFLIMAVASFPMIGATLLQQPIIESFNNLK